MYLLVSKSDFNNEVNISVNVKEAQLNVHIANAQQFYLKDMLGRDLYDAIQDSPTDSRIVTLVGKLVNIMVRLTYSIYVVESRVTDTQFGGVIKQGEYTQYSDIKYINRIAETERQRAISLFNDVAIFLSENTDIYPEWLGTCRTNSSYKYTKVF